MVDHAKNFKKNYFCPFSRGFLTLFNSGGHSEASAPTQPDPVHNLIGMTALVMWPKLLNSVKSDHKITF